VLITAHLSTGEVYFCAFGDAQISQLLFAEDDPTMRRKSQTASHPAPLPRFADCNRSRSGRVISTRPRSAAKPGEMPENVAYAWIEKAYRDAISRGLIERPTLEVNRQRNVECSERDQQGPLSIASEHRQLQYPKHDV
jgi:hypothetical protein